MIEREAEALLDAFHTDVHRTETEQRQAEIAYLARRDSILRRAAQYGIEVDLPQLATPATASLKRSSIMPIAECVASVTGFDLDAIRGPSRKKNLAKARHIFVFLLRRFTPKSLPQIGGELGGRDHTTILHGLRRAEAVLTMGLAAQPSEDTPLAWTEALWAAEWPELTGWNFRKPSKKEG